MQCEYSPLDPLAHDEGGAPGAGRDVAAHEGVELGLGQVEAGGRQTLDEVEGAAEVGEVVTLLPRPQPRLIGEPRDEVYVGPANYKGHLLEYNISNGQLSDVTGSAHVMGRYLANAIVSDKSK